MTNTSILSRVGLGTANFGKKYGIIRDDLLSDPNTAPEQAEKILDSAFMNGIFIFDTAHNYGMSEEIIGKYLQKTGREAFVISKFTPSVWQKASYESSKRLGKNLRVLLWHNFEASNPFLEEFSKKSAEFAREFPDILWGCSTYGTESAQSALRSGLFKVIEIEFNLLNTRVFEFIAKQARKKGVRLVLRSVLQKGFLTDDLLRTEINVCVEPEKNKRLSAIGKKLTELSHDAKLSVEEMALRYATSVTDDEVILVGALSEIQLTQSIALLSRPKLEPALISALQTIRRRCDPDLLDLRLWRT